MEYETLIDFLKRAMEKVGTEYFNFQTAGNSSAIQRERVYCYELYHQMRCLQVNSFSRSFVGLSINGEVDKSGHEIISNRFNPDFVIHHPGNMANNFAVIEVKVNKDKKGIIKDLTTLTCMLHCYNYQYGILLLKGITKEEFQGIASEALETIPRLNDVKDNITVFCENSEFQKLPVFLTISE